MLFLIKTIGHTTHIDAKDIYNTYKVSFLALPKVLFKSQEPKAYE